MEKDRDPSRNVPKPVPPKGDLGEKGKTWSPGQAQGISNRKGDEASGDFDEFDPNATKH